MKMNNLIAIIFYLRDDKDSTKHTPKFNYVRPTPTFHEKKKRKQQKLT